ncbi:MAG: 30S ribosomal protein S17 [Nitrospirota bacterium]|nr:30S ribosomal protein S17 [Nitrospirota bacterium]MDH5587325.1 30S ribosomal protein S17 [Nitrospirota bacterium]MDH5774304.1 30S ribosomal protein S17 [Nitrospirota bacterium]
MTQTRSVPRALFGKVVSNKMQKTVVVEVIRIERHSLYGKVLRRKTKMKAHDEQSQCKVGDQVKLVYSRPISKSKSWRIAEVCGKEAAT